MPPKTPVMTSGLSTSRRNNDISIVNDDMTQDSQIAIMRELREVINQINNNQLALDNKVNKMGLSRVKLPSIERFNGTRLKLKGFLLQMWFKII